MIAELGQIALLGALLVAVCLGILPLAGARNGNARLMAVAPRAAAVQAALVAGSFALLTWAFLVQDFSVEYVARNSNSRLPVEYRFSAVWGAHEGSLLLWELILALWTLAVALFSASLPQVFRARVLGVLGLISVGFLVFIIYTSNPFGRLLPPAAEGMDLNPLLQDPGLIIHPPMLYMGYVGFAVAFAFAVAALLGGQVNREWVRWSRPWTHVAWAFLTAGIALGSWWAYYELGWGGWWFWDPVENASFMPWLVGTALIHSQAVTEKRGAFRNWTLLLAIAAFSLSLLGTFLVRSGVLTSVHAFATDPTRGVFILIYLVLVVGGSLALFAIKAPRMIQGQGFAGMSRETMLLVNNLLLAVMAGMVLVGTLYPLAVEALDAGKISVGAPYFGLMFALLLVPMVVAMPWGVFARWREDRPGRVARALAPSLAVAIAAGGVTAVMAPQSGLQGIAGVAGGAWLMAASVAWPIRRLRQASRFTRGETAMTLAHFGVGVFLIGVSLTGTISSEQHLRMAPGDRFELGGYAFAFTGIRGQQGPNYVADEGEFIVSRDGEEITRLYPQKRRYFRNGQVMTEAAIDPGLTRDIYVSLGEPLDDGQAWAVRLYHKPFVRWIWLGTLFMAAAGLLAAGDRRFRRQRSAAPAPGAEAATA
ncbi:MAG: heme lyase CcmF/NrfE family subunit [Xanthomonadales bacterium]|nr:heme lyase CcmF/NrfE family subunit [Xanthomonadales bacterium]NIT46227.1 heme lyase CcmF/NrfE family subunit [Stutzerimonas stutzeri]NIN59907.1 heme lyase CcmF/NrfE family subunit [Xanthomonadales bacterium]NIN75281.1 heme lyase CcmF/NrfE family subunit [Xanthomonadales bacterium]NIO15150.1 heme lyase CcmF/NrfE family subunit [Xanthomonadales bacterium]